MLSATSTPLAEAFDVALVDLDGVAYRGRHAIPHAAESLVEARTRGLGLVFVTNNASREPEEVAGHLSELGIPTTAPEVMTAAQAAAALLRERLPEGAQVLVVGGAGLTTAVRAAGFEVVTSADDQPDAVVQGFAPHLGWRDLAEAAYAVAGGAWFVASNLDLSLPTERGFAPGNGALVGAVRAATGVEPAAAGKPGPAMYHLAVERRGGGRPLVIGDRLDTDLAGAQAAGYPGLHVFTGVSTPRDTVLAAPGERPHFLGADLRALLEPHDAPRQDGAGWRAGDAVAHVRDGRLELSGDLEGVDAVRAACAAVWSAVDEGRTVDPVTVPDLPGGRAL